MREKYLRVESLSLSRLNNAEFIGFMHRVLGLLPEGEGSGTDEGYPEVSSLSTAEASDISSLYIDAGLIEELTACLDKLVSLTRETRTNQNTQELVEIDKKRDSLVKYILKVVSQARTLPLEAQQAAGQRLYSLLSVYSGTDRLPQEQETTVIRGMLEDIGREEFADDVELLGIRTMADELKQQNELFAEKSMARRLERGAARQSDKTTDLRAEASELYQELTERAFAANLLHGNEVTEKFLTDLNNEIAETRADLNRRGSKGETDTEESGGDADDDRPVVQ